MDIDIIDEPQPCHLRPELDGTDGKCWRVSLPRAASRPLHRCGSSSCPWSRALRSSRPSPTPTPRCHRRLHHPRLPHPSCQRRDLATQACRRGRPRHPCQLPRWSSIWFLSNSSRSATPAVSLPSGANDSSTAAISTERTQRRPPARAAARSAACRPRPPEHRGHPTLTSKSSAPFSCASCRRSLSATRPHAARSAPRPCRPCSARPSGRP